MKTKTKTNLGGCRGVAPLIDTRLTCQLAFRMTERDRASLERLSKTLARTTGDVMRIALRELAAKHKGVAS